MACARMDEEALPEHIRRSFGNNYKQNKNKYRILLKGLCRCAGQLYHLSKHWHMDWEVRDAKTRKEGRPQTSKTIKVKDEEKKIILCDSSKELIK